jgi:hypothetical protein
MNTFVTGLISRGLKKGFLSHKGLDFEGAKGQLLTTSFLQYFFFSPFSVAGILARATFLIPPPHPYLFASLFSFYLKGD